MIEASVRPSLPSTPFPYVTVAKADMARKPAVKEASLVNCGAELSLNADGMISIAATWINVPEAIAAMIPKVLLSVVCVCVQGETEVNVIPSSHTSIRACCCTYLRNRKK